MRVQGWDPVMIICQIISIQSLHYLALSLLLPPLLTTFTHPSTLQYSGGPATVSHILDWRELASRPTISSSAFQLPDFSLDSAAEGWRKLRGAWAGGKQVGVVEDDQGGIGTGEKAHVGVEDELEALWDFGVDDARGWVIGAAWLVASGFDILPLYYLVRRPTHILDFSLTLTFNHLILTTYYAKSFPTSLFFWVVQALGALLMIVVAEQLCVKREMQTDLDIAWNPSIESVESGEVIELNER
ncbi:integral membrane protein S linking to the trans Golgi network-domain-containing protein [Naematelia encephala]|uniref:Integral membrane protein S linking to the trans Golgi network-domain-containing protein n=1 Tax=Naematelia encephala TaxID=71784 RepID=A0A1Y2AQ57_9TREE|nr:integral membrane protein S linking to the trans Golgi network-domain-containing protein [Naematelia encephala]